MHSVTVTELKIEGAQLETYPTVSYQYGYLTEYANRDWQGMLQSAPIAHGYFIYSDGGKARNEWYVHNHTLDRYVVVTGRLEVALFDAREGSASQNTIEVFQIGSISSGLPSGMRIPPGVWHSFKSVQGEYLFLNHKHPGYNRENPDKYRIPMPNDQCSHSWQ